MTQCCAITKKGLRCSFRATEIYEGVSFCKKHLQCVKSNDECPICYDSLNSKGRTKLKLSCGHFFHKECLSECVKSECPICRAPFAPSIAKVIYYEKKIGPLVDKLFSVPQENRSSAIGCIEHVLAIASASDTTNAANAYREADVVTLHRILYNIYDNGRNSQLFYHMLQVFDLLSIKIKENGSFDNITIIGKNNKLFLY